MTEADSTWRALADGTLPVLAVREMAVAPRADDPHWPKCLEQRLRELPGTGGVVAIDGVFRAVTAWLTDHAEMRRARMATVDEVAATYFKSLVEHEIHPQGATKR